MRQYKLSSYQVLADGELTRATGRRIAKFESHSRIDTNACSRMVSVEDKWAHEAHNHTAPAAVAAALSRVHELPVQVINVDLQLMLLRFFFLFLQTSTFQ